MENKFELLKKQAHVSILEKTFKKVFSKYAKNDVVNSLFDQVCKSYSNTSRHYHDTNHISYMSGLWECICDKLNNPDAIFFAIIYHDIIYKPRRSDNEEKSAEYFRKKIAPLLSISDDISYKVVNAIIATKHNESSKAIWERDTDIQYLLDIDLAILGTKHEDTYEWYRKGVRKEYKIYPDLLYKPGRKKVLESFLNRKKIYITKYYQKSFEKNARKNLQNEINLYL